MVRLYLEQGSQKWLDLRKTKVTASDAACVMGCGFATPRQRWYEKMGLKEVIVTDRMRRGLALEETARKAYEKITGHWTMPGVYQHDTYDWMLASLDGITLEEDLVLEIKCPGKLDHATAKSGKVPEKYWPQMQHQLMCVGIDRAQYFSYLHDGDVALLDVKRDDEYCERLLREEEVFWQCVRDGDLPELTDADYDHKEDEDFYIAAAELKEASAEVAKWKKLYEVRRQRCIDLAGGVNSRGNGIKIRCGTSKGVINYKQIPELQGLDLERYRGPETVSWTITVDKG